MIARMLRWMPRLMDSPADRHLSRAALARVAPPLALVLAACGGPGTAGGVWFAERPDALAQPFVFDNGAEGKFWLPEIMGGGAALLDHDGDGDLDILLPNGGRLAEGAPATGDDGAAVRLYRNDGGWRFVAVDAAAGIGDSGYNTGVAVGDVDNDGDVDVYFANYGPDRLYLNDGKGAFRDGTREAGVDVGGWSASAAFCDYDADDDLDLYVTRYVVYDPAIGCTDPIGRPDFCSPQNFQYEPDVLLQNDGRGRFTDVSEASGITAERRPGLGVVCDDFDDDGRPDFYVADDGTANLLWHNEGGGTFRDVAVEWGAAFSAQGLPRAGMGLVAADLNHDERIDLFVTNLTNEGSSFYRNLGGDGGFQEVSSSTGLGVPSIPDTGFGVVPLDIELDGDTDLAVVNGSVRLLEEPGKLRSEIKEDADMWERYAQRNKVYLNDGKGVFTVLDTTACGLCDPPAISRGIARGDLDGDGDLDLVIGRARGAASVYENRAPRTGRWLRLRVLDPRTRRDAFGARVTVEAGGRRWVETVSPAVGYLSSSDPRVHIGLGGAESVDRVTVRWPDGTREGFAIDCVDCEVAIRRGEGEAAP